jgi:hypothetical protein
VAPRNIRKKLYLNQNEKKIPTKNNSNNFFTTNRMIILWMKWM